MKNIILNLHTHLISISKLTFIQLFRFCPVTPVFFARWSFFCGAAAY
jgi:hypothetical protein